MPRYATMVRVTAEEFGAEVRRRRELHDWSRPDLSRQSGVSQQALLNIENGYGGPRSGDYPTSKRRTVIAIARALDWPVDDALHLAGHDPLADEERARLEAPPDALRWRRLGELWARMTASQQKALVATATAMVDPDSAESDTPQPAPATAVYRLRSSVEADG